MGSPSSKIEFPQSYLAGLVHVRSEWERLDSVPVQRLAELIEERLRGRGEAAPPALSRDEEPEDLFIAEYERSEKSEVRGRFRDAISVLVYGWSDPSKPGTTSDDILYLSRLIRLCDRLRVREANQWLLVLALNPRSQEWATPYDRDIHCQALRALQFNQLEDDRSGRPDLVPFWLKDLHDPLYAAAAFRGLYIGAPDEAVGHFPEVLDVARQNPAAVDLVAVMWLFFEYCGEERFLQVVRQAADEPEPTRQAVRDAIEHLPGIPATTQQKVISLISSGAFRYTFDYANSVRKHAEIDRWMAAQSLYRDLLRGIDLKVSSSGEQKLYVLGLSMSSPGSEESQFNDIKAVRTLANRLLEAKK